MTPPEISPRLSRRVEALVFFTVFLDLVGFGIVIPLLPFYVQTLGGSARTVGVLLGCFSFTQLLATPILGRSSDRYGRRPIILLSLAANAVTMGLFALATHLGLLWLLFASRILAGATAGNLSACQAALADVSTVATRARAMGRLGAGIGLGLVLGPLLGGLVAGWGAWLPPLAAGGLALLGTLGVLLAMPETHSPELSFPSVPRPRGRLASFHDTPRKRALLLILALYFFVFIAMTTVQVALALLVQARLDWGTREVGYLFALMGVLGLVIQGALIGPLSGLVGEVRLLVLGALLLVAGMAAMAIAARPWSLVGALALFGTGFGIVQPLLSSLASQVATQERQGATLGLAQSFGGLARTVGPVMHGALFSTFGPAAPFSVGALASLVAAALGALLGREGLGRTHRPDPPG